ncbi:hypothetical protein BgAZ_206230 [Babesia gibsoni]|uniref:Uncharacterized protein n=1 Tax=Babesia gibsoni TaxID=33632 RepID=A0AAD8PEB1_BABGI|nr:hypothetical protein BgAZ_206230 [Babesia gibsoni]
MECTIYAVVQDERAPTGGYITLHDGRKRSLGVPPRPAILEKSRGSFFTKLHEPIRHLLRELYNMVEMYYFTADRPALMDMNASQKEITSYISAILGYLRNLGQATSSAISNLSIASFLVRRGNQLSSKTMVLMYGYFCHSMSLTVSTGNRGLLLLSSYDKGTINIAFSRVKCEGLLQFTHITNLEADEGVTSYALGFEDKGPDEEAFVSCVTVDPSSGLGTTILLGYSNCVLEVWKESVCITDMREVLCEAVAQCRVASYPFYAAFGPSGELAIVLTVEDMLLVEWTGSAIVGVKLVDGSSSDLWTPTRIKILAAEWLNSHELLSLSENGELWLSRRSEMGYWQRIAQYILVDGIPKTSTLTSWISRMQYDGRGNLFIKMCGSHQLLQLKWDKKVTPVLTIVEFPVKDTGILSKPTKEELNGTGKLSIADFALEARSSLIAVTVSDRSLVCIYNYPSMRFSHSIEPPKPYLKVGGLKFLNSGKESQCYLAVKWVEMSLEIFQELDDFEIEHRRTNRGGKSIGRLTVVYSMFVSTIQEPDWQSKTLAEILAGSEENVVTSHLKGPKNSIYRRGQKYSTDIMPQLSIFRPTFPEKLVAGSTNSVMFDDAFSHRGQVFGRKLPKNDSRMFPMEGTHTSGTRGDQPHVESSLFMGNDLPRTHEAKTPIYSMEEFTRRKRVGL